MLDLVEISIRQTYFEGGREHMEIFLRMTVMAFTSVLFLKCKDNSFVIVTSLCCLTSCFRLHFNFR